MPTLPEIIRRAEDDIRVKISRRERIKIELSKCPSSEELRALPDDQIKRWGDLADEQVTVRNEIKRTEDQLSTWRLELAEDQRVDGLARQSYPTHAGESSQRHDDALGRLGQQRASGALDGTYTVDRVNPSGSGHRSASGGTAQRWTRADGRAATVDRAGRFADHPVVAEYAASRAQSERPVLETHGGLGNLVRSLNTGTGSAVIPTLWASEIIDRARNYAAVLAAGASIVPMDSKIMQIGRLTADPSASFRAEGSTIAASDPNFDYVQLSANTLSCLVVGSMEFFQDANNVDNIISEALAKAVANELDLNALYGGLVSGSETGTTGFNRTLAAPPSPRGVLAALLATAPANVLGNQANGTTQNAATPWNEIIDTVYTPADSNEVVNGLIWPSRMARRYAEQYDTLGQPLRMPDALAAIPRFVSNQIPSNMTVGTSADNMSDVFAGDWTQLLVGQRLDFQVQVLQERYAELGQIAILATWRGDVQPARPKAFSCYRYLKNT